jgi:acetyl-CoA acyltransferase
MSSRTYVVGVGMTKFDKPGTKEDDYPDWAREAGERALADAGVPYDAVEQAFLGYCYGDSTYGQRSLYQLGLTGIPVINVNNNCSTGSSALFLARQAVRGGLVDCALALGFEKMEKGSLGVKYTDRTNAIDKHAEAMFSVRAPDDSPAAPGGLISKGHPLGATGLAQCSELTWQLRGEAGERQVDGDGVALQHNIGLGGAAVVTVYRPAA